MSPQSQAYMLKEKIESPRTNAELVKLKVIPEQQETQSVLAQAMKEVIIATKQKSTGGTSSAIKKHVFENLIYKVHEKARQAKFSARKTSRSIGI